MLCTNFCVVIHIEELDYFQLKLYMGPTLTIVIPSNRF